MSIRITTIIFLTEDLWKVIVKVCVWSHTSLYEATVLSDTKAHMQAETHTHTHTHSHKHTHTHTQSQHRR